MAKIWEPLSKPLESTRVFEILPSKSGIYLSFRLHEIKLSDHVQYDAISYTWGEDPSTVPITIHGQPYEIRRYLWTFIDILRGDSATAQWLWVDALSIDQSDPVEKGQQVSIIGKIFGRAKTVRAWLGPDADGSSQLMSKGFMAVSDRWPDLGASWAPFGSRRRKLRAHWRGLHVLVDIKLDHREIMSMEWLSRSPLRKLLGAREANGINELRLANYKLFARPYWLRTWICQEVVLAPELIFYCGRQHSDSEVFFRPTNSLNFVETPESSFIWIDQTVARIVNSHWYARALSKAQSRSLDELLSDFYETRCADLRDKIYALLPLAKSTPGMQQLRVDYTPSTFSRCLCVLWTIAWWKMQTRSGETLSR